VESGRILRERGKRYMAPGNEMIVKDILKTVLPRFVIDHVKDQVDIFSGRRERLVPPERMNFVGDGDFKEIGGEFLDYFIRLGGLNSGDKVLDIGCGLGRMARPLVPFLDPDKEGEYHGFDIVPNGISW
jgi:2-polyprenyl-3-methyl-5-hydroxy-6-metoxy-1,4-benzoquinol methylase